MFLLMGIMALFGWMEKWSLRLYCLQEIAYMFDSAKDGVDMYEIVDRPTTMLRIASSSAFALFPIICLATPYLNGLSSINIQYISSAAALPT